MRIKIIFAAAPAQAREAAAAKRTLAHLAYQMGAGPHLYRGGSHVAPEGGLMVVGDRDFEPRGAPEPFVVEATQECAARMFEGVLLDFEKPPSPLSERIVRLLDESLRKQEKRLYVQETYADFVKYGHIVIPSAISGGSLELRLQEAAEKYGAGRLLLGAQRVASDFYLPAPGGKGRALTQEELRELMEGRSPSIFFSQELCARYFTYSGGQNGVHFVLFDDASSLREKLRLADSLGIPEALLAWPDVHDCWAQLI